MNYLTVSWVPFYFLIRVIVNNHDRNGLYLRPISLFHLFLLAFQVVNIVVTVPIDTSPEHQAYSFRRVTRVLFLVLDSSRVVLSCLTLYELCRMRSNEGPAKSQKHIFDDNREELII